MAENDQSAVVQELYRRRDSLDPDKRAVVDELAKRMNIAQPEKTGFLGRMGENLSGLGSLAVGVLTHPLETGKAMLTPDPAIAKESADAFNRGDYGRAAGSLIEDIPLIGPQIRRTEQDIRKGDFGAIGADVATAAALGKVPGLVKKIPGVARVGQIAGDIAHDPLGLAHADPAAAGATLERLGVPTPATTAPASPIPGIARQIAEKLAAKHPVIQGGLMAIDIAKALHEVVNETPAPEAAMQSPTPAAPQLQAAPAPTPETPVAAPVPEEVAPSLEAPYQPSTVAEKLEGLDPDLQRQILAFRSRRRGIPATPSEAAVEPTPAAVADIPETPTAAAKKLSPGAADAKALSDKLGQWDFTPDEAKAMNEKGWIKLAFDSGVKLPSAAVRKNAIFNLIKDKAGPPMTAEQLFEKFRAAGK